MTNILILNGSLKPFAESHTGKLIDMLVTEFYAIEPEASVERIDLLGMNILAGVEEDMGDGDAWPPIADKVRAADIVVVATPIWWMNRSSLIQRVIERMDSFTDKAGYGTLTGKVAGVLVAGGEDGGQAVQAGLMEVLTYFGFTLPASCGVYDLGQPQFAEALPKNVKATASSLLDMAKRMRVNVGTISAPRALFSQKELRSRSKQ